MSGRGCMRQRPAGGWGAWADQQSQAWVAIERDRADRAPTPGGRLVRHFALDLAEQRVREGRERAVAELLRMYRVAREQPAKVQGERMLRRQQARRRRTSRARPAARTSATSDDGGGGSRGDDPDPDHRRRRPQVLRAGRFGGGLS